MKNIREGIHIDYPQLLIIDGIHPLPFIKAVIRSRSITSPHAPTIYVALISYPLSDVPNTPRKRYSITSDEEAMHMKALFVGEKSISLNRWLGPPLWFPLLFHLSLHEFFLSSLTESYTSFALPFTQF